MRFICVIAIALVSDVHGHGFVEFPKARNYVAYRQGQDYCPHCLNGPSPTVCGGPGQTNKMMYDSNPTSSFETQFITKAGEDLKMDLALTANHGGYHSVRIACATGSQRANEISGWIDLERAEQDRGDFTFSADYPTRAFIPGACCLEDWKEMFQREIDAGNKRVSLSTNAYPGAVRVTTYWKIPSDFQCEHAVGQWSWMTANTCTLGMSNQEMSKAMGCTISNSQCASQSDLEFFQNCFDIKVLPGDGTPVPSSSTHTTTEVPTTSPTEAPTPVTTTRRVSTEATTHVPATTQASTQASTQAPETTESPATTQAATTQQSGYYTGTWKGVSGGYECSCKQVAYETPYSTNDSCVKALKDGTGDYQCTAEQSYYAFAYQWRPDLGGFPCECRVVSWATQFTSAESCVDAFRDRCIEERRLEDTSIVV